MNALSKILSSSTAWFTVLLGAVSTVATNAALPVPPWLAAAGALAYGLKEAAAKLSSESTPSAAGSSRTVLP